MLEAAVLNSSTVNKSLSLARGEVSKAVFLSPIACMEKLACQVIHSGAWDFSVSVIERPNVHLSTSPSCLRTEHISDQYSTVQYSVDLGELWIIVCPWAQLHF